MLAGNGLGEMGRCWCSEGASRKDGEGGGRDGTGHDVEGQIAWVHPTLIVCLQGPQIEDSIRGWKADKGNTKRGEVVVINNSHHWCLTIL